ncbi:Putative bacteriophage-related protein [Magnetospirillum gryphiswaldense MSR-1 v2]|jgi:hypothetical protein|uniref:Bacteriophage-related protein n=2 Tax=Rhodospirillales TaxID=204441 RepID=V6F2X4_MAGGM|nr:MULTISPECIES: hypothetical protein [Rhodospirillales]EME69886.1 hypothetical protein H261_10794 [Paramagnetospirillum caucaseum]CDK99752.1 Putative bacteriophage-related protein [Magnetospirillum gryphiswaldense MSR-1 v2]
MTADIRIDTLTIRVPLTLRRYGGRKLVIVPEGDGVPVRAKPTPDDTLLKALARAHRWKRMLESGKVASLNELSEAEKINPSYLTRIYRLTLLAPDIVETILDGRQPRTIQLANLMDDMPVEWDRQRERYGITAR